MNVMRTREVKTQHYADGGFVKSIKEKFFGGATPVATPAPTPAPMPAANTIAGYSGMSAMQKREKDAGLKNGGKVKGPGTSTSDSVPAKLSTGEYVLPADTTKAIGTDKLDAVRAMTHVPVGKKPGAIRKMADGGCLRPKMMADGGLVTDEERKRLVGLIPGDTSTAQIAAAPTDTSTELGRNISNTLAAIPGAGPTVGAIRTMAGASSLFPSASGVVSRLANLAAPVAPYAPVAAGVAALQAGAGTDTAPSPTLTAPRTTRPAAAAPVAPVTVTTPAAPANSFTDGKQPSLDTRGTVSPQNMAAADALAARYAPTATEAPVTQPLTVLADNGGYGLLDKAALATRNARVGADSSPASGSVTFASGGPLARLASAERIAAGNNSTSRANTLDSVAAQREGQQTSAAAQLAGHTISALAAKYGVDATAGTAAQRLALETQTHSQDATLKAGQIKLAAQTEAARTELLNAKTDDAKAAAVEKLRALQGKYEKDVPDLYAPIETGTDPTTQAKTFGVLNKRTGEVTDAAGKAVATTPKFETGKTYQDAKGNKAKWDGSKFVPA